MISIVPSRLSGWSLAAIAFLAAVASQNLRAQAQQAQAAAKLDTLVVSATRVATDPATIPSSVSLISLDAVEEAQIPDLHTALSQVAGVTVFNSGAAGSQSTLYIRGGSSAQTLLMVDGVRMSTRQSDFYGRSVMGSAGLAGYDRIEVLRGPQGTLYGSSAMGGVILMDTTHGCGALSGALSVTGGSFDTRAAAASVQGGTKTLGYSASLSSSYTANDRPKNDNRVTSFSTRIEGKASDQVLLGFTVRTQEGKYQEPGSTLYYSPGDIESNSYLATTYGEFQLGGFKSRLTFGWNQISYAFYDTSGSIWASNSYNRSTRRVLDWQNTWTPYADLTVVAGYNVERSRFVTPSLGDGLTDASDGVYLSLDQKVTKEISVIAGVRHDHFDTAGTADTGRVGASYRIVNTKTKLRATLGSGFGAPAMTERYGDSNWYVASPNLKSEKSNGWDVGIDQELGGRATVGVTFFENHFRDMIVSNSVAGYKYQWQNVNRAQTRGLEFETTVKIIDGLKARASYTYLDAYDMAAHTRVAYKPRQTGDVELSYQATQAWLVGVGAHATVDRMKNATTPLESYTTVRLFSSYELSKSLILRARVENLLDERYEENLGYPALPIAFYGGVEWRF